MKQAPWSVYIVECSDKRLYTGISNDVAKRVATHNKGKGCKFTKGRYPVKLVYREECGTRSDALKREQKIKGFPRSRKFKMVSSA